MRYIQNKNTQIIHLNQLDSKYKTILIRRTNQYRNVYKRVELESEINERVQQELEVKY